MKILFDGRALQSPIRSGVPRVAEWWLNKLAEEHDVTVLTTGFRKWIPAFAGMTEGARMASHVHIRIPNKLLHLSLLLFGWPHLDTLATRKTSVTYDAVYVPNIHFFASSAPYTLLVHDLSFLVFPQFFSPFERLIHVLKRPLKLLLGAERLLAVSKSTAFDVRRFTGREAEIRSLDFAFARDDKGTDFSAVGLEMTTRRDVVFLSTTEPRKNLENAIRGFLASGSEERLLIIGAITRDGRMLQRRYRHEQRIVWLGSIADAERTELLRKTRALLYPSRFEGYGLPLVEAQALGTPIITSGVTSMPEVAPKAYLIDPARPETIAQALKML